MRAPKVCTSPRCPNFARTGRSKCATCEGAADQARGSAAQRGYGARWQRTSARFLRRNPMCAVPGCGQPSAHADHVRLRSELVREVANPDADEHLQPLCHSHHSAKTARETGLGRLRD